MKLFQKIKSIFTTEPVKYLRTGVLEVEAELSSLAGTYKQDLNIRARVGELEKNGDYSKCKLLDSNFEDNFWMTAKIQQELNFIKSSCIIWDKETQ